MHKWGPSGQILYGRNTRTTCRSAMQDAKRRELAPTHTPEGQFRKRQWKYIREGNWREVCRECQAKFRRLAVHLRITHHMRLLEYCRKWDTGADCIKRQICRQCQTVFYLRREAIYCSMNCYAKAKLGVPASPERIAASRRAALVRWARSRQARTRICLQCSKEFIRWSGKDNINAKFCSMTCYTAWRGWITCPSYQLNRMKKRRKYDGLGLS